MARIIGGNPLGFFSGKMGGLVFAHNKGGQYVRQFVKPVDAQTSGQIDARVSFAQAISAFHTMSPVLKSAWNSFASQYFNSKKRGNVPGIHSGVNAFVSLRNVLINMDRTKTDFQFVTLQVNTTPVTLPVGKNIEFSNIAPISPLQGVLDSGNYTITGASTVDISNNISTINVIFNVAWNSTPSAPTPVAKTSSIMTDGNGKKVGIAVYSSNLLVQEGVFVQNPDIVLVGNTGLIDSYVTPSVVTTNLNFEIPISIQNSGVKNFPVEGGTYRLQAYLFNEEGQILKIAESTTSIS